ncbi:MAG: tetratricopeptide repeat protein [Sphingobacteriaceae bacterium]|nr:tetratricopeptide repeat protein [Sphingobacteriaceae bacterium]
MNRNFLIALLFLLVGGVSAQKTAIFLDKDELYKTGLELFDKKQYTSAQKNFDEYILKSTSSVLKTDAQFYAAACGVELFHKDGEWRMKQFIEKHPESLKKNLAWFYLGKSNFRKKKYKETIEYLEKTEGSKLNKEDLAEMQFKRGYSYLMEGNTEKAKTDLAEIKDKDNKYMNPAIYYFSHISYTEKNYGTALQGFNKLVNNETFGSVVPYYITQIYFIQGKYETVTQTAPQLLNDSANIQKADEINRMIGESYYNLKKYSDALVYLKKTNLASDLNPQGNYALGYCYYKTNDCPNAIKQFEKATTPKDSISQSAWYHMADCYMKQGDKLKAKNAFYSAYQLSFDQKIEEDALFSFAKISYELDFSPYNEAVKAFSKYLKEYPSSPRKDECYTFLINVYSTTRNYDLAIKSIESMGTIDPILKYTYQKLIYFKGVDAFNNDKFDEAEKQFKKSQAQNTDLVLNALNQYWMGEISYMRKDYTTAIDAWKKFLVMEGSISLPEYDLANYNIGYAHFQRKEKGDYTEANIAFRKYLLSKNLIDMNKKADASLRAADCYFMNNTFPQAADLYAEAINLNKLDVDYAIYQKALCQGLLKKYKEKIADLKTIETKYPGSVYTGKVLNEMADTYYENLKDEENAILYYTKILNNYPKSSSTQNCYAKLGNIYFGRKEDDKAFEYFDKFVKADSKSEEAKNVLEQIKTIFKAKGQIDAMEKYFADLGNPLNVNQVEAATYETAKTAQYDEKNIDAAFDKWAAYITRFPEGKYTLEAQFNYAETAYNKNMFEKALPAYNYILSKTRNLYTETSLAKASYINYKAKNYTASLPQFMQLKDIAESPLNKTNARFGSMRCAFYLNKFDTSLAACNEILTFEKVYPQQTTEIKYIKAKCLYETNRLDDALIEFKAMSKTSKNISGAEAYYYMSMIYFKKQDYKEVEKTVNKLIGYEYSNDDWNNKGMLLLADTYIAKGDDADAQVILETIIDGKPKQIYLDEAIAKLEALKAKQAKKEEEAKQRSSEEMKIEFKGDGSNPDLNENDPSKKQNEQPEQPK